MYSLRDERFQSVIPECTELLYIFSQLDGMSESCLPSLCRGSAAQIHDSVPVILLSLLNQTYI